MPILTMKGGAGTPAEPDWSSIYDDELDIASASEHWGKIVPKLQAANTLAVANGDATRRLVEFHVKYIRASKHVAEHGDPSAEEQADEGGTMEPLLVGDASGEQGDSPARG